MVGKALLRLGDSGRDRSLPPPAQAAMASGVRSPATADLCRMAWGDYRAPVGASSHCP